MNSSVRAREESDRLLRQAIGKIFSMKLASGTTRQSLYTFAIACASDAVKAHSGRNIKMDLDIHKLGSVLRTWHTETRFLTLEGKPKALAIEGRNGLRSLISVHYSNGRVQDVMAALRSSKLIKEKRKGLWLPTERHARIPMPTPELLGHFAEGVARFADTVSRNTSSTNKRELMFERASMVSRLPIGESKAFREYVEAQGVAFLNAIDDWLESRQVNRIDRKKQTCPAGVYAFAFVGETIFRGNQKQMKRDIDQIL